jgi:hypothetical protein
MVHAHEDLAFILSHKLGQELRHALVHAPKNLVAVHPSRDHFHCHNS